MPDTKISALGSLIGSTCSSADLVPIVSLSSSTTKKYTVQAMFDAVQQVPTVTSGQVTTADLMNFYSVSGATAQQLTMINAGRALLAASTAPITNSLAADVALNNTANYSDGPSIAQGTVGTWFVIGTVTVTDTVTAEFFIKLWDGTTVLSSAVAHVTSTNLRSVITLCGYIAAPAGNLRISGRDLTSPNGKMLFNDSGNFKDCTITAIRIA